MLSKNSELKIYAIEHDIVFEIEINGQSKNNKLILDEIIDWANPEGTY